MSSRPSAAERLRLIQWQLNSVQEQVIELAVELQSGSDFELVGSSRTDPSTPQGSRGRPGGYPSPSARPSPSGSGGTDIELRERAAIETGRYFQRCLSGTARGPPGRDLVNLPANIYVVIQEFSGTQHTFPILRYTRYSAVLKLVQNPSRRGDFGNSVFAGFNEEWEARLAVSTAGFVWPDHTD